MGMRCVSWWTWPSRRSNLPPVWDKGGRPMARRTFDVIDVTEILMHWHAGRSKNEMAQSLGVDRKTLRKYIAPAAAGIRPGGPAILDIYSRYAVGWMVATRESAVLAEKLIAATCAKQGIARGQLSIHADRGS